MNSKDKADSQAEHLEQTFADRLAQIIGVESVASFSRRSGIGEILLRKYLNGSLPTVKNLVILADAGATSIGWLASGRPPQIAAEVLEEYTIGNTNPPAINDDLQLLICYRQADKQQKAAIHALLEAIVKPSGNAWGRAHSAVTEISKLFTWPK